MMALPPSEHHHDCESQRVFPPSKWRGSRHYKRPLTTQSKREVKYSLESPWNTNMLDCQTDKSFGGCVRTTYPDIFCRKIEGCIVLSWGGEYFRELHCLWDIPASTLGAQMVAGRQTIRPYSWVRILERPLWVALAPIQMYNIYEKPFFALWWEIDFIFIIPIYNNKL